MSTMTPQTIKEVTHVGADTSRLCESEVAERWWCLTLNDPEPAFIVKPVSDLCRMNVAMW